MKIRFILMLFLGAGLLVSCSTGNDAVNKRINARALAAIQKGATSKEQVRALLGAPQSSKTQMPVQQQPGMPSLPAKYTALEIWGYWTDVDKGPSFHLPFAHAARKPPCSVVIYLDERGTVLDWETSGEVPQ